MSFALYRYIVQNKWKEDTSNAKIGYRPQEMRDATLARNMYHRERTADPIFVNTSVLLVAFTNLFQKPFRKVPVQGTRCMRNHISFKTPTLSLCIWLQAIKAA